MTTLQAKPTLAAGFGCRQGCEASVLLQLLENALLAHQIDLASLAGLAAPGTAAGVLQCRGLATL